MHAAPLPSTPTPAPGPRGLAMLRLIPDIARGRLLQALGDLQHRHGDIVRLPFGTRQALLVVRPEHVRHVLVERRDHYGKGAVFARIKPILGNGLVASEGAYWQRQRRLLQPPFTKHGVNDFVAAIATVAEDTAAALTSANGQAVNISLAMRTAAMSVICRTMLDIRIADRQSELAEAFGFVLDECARRVTSPLAFAERLPLPRQLRFRRYLSGLNDLVYGTIGQRRRAPGTRDLVADLIDARDPESGERMTDEQLRDEIMTIFFAGHETTALSLAWCWYLLSQNPEAGAALQAESDRVLGGRPATAASLEHLVYARAVFYEALRLYPPAWAIPREALSDDFLGGFQVRYGDIILICPFLTHRLPDLWPEPENFKPERFLDGVKAAQERYGFVPFGAGPRTCIGNHFAVAEAQILLSMIAGRADLALPRPTHVAWNAASTLKPNADLVMQVTARGNN